MTLESFLALQEIRARRVDWAANRKPYLKPKAEKPRTVPAPRPPLLQRHLTLVTAEEFRAMCAKVAERRARAKARRRARQEVA